jgi:hypothetical protein
MYEISNYHYYAFIYLFFFKKKKVSLLCIYSKATGWQFGLGGAVFDLLLPRKVKWEINIRIVKKGCASMHA